MSWRPRTLVVAWALWELLRYDLAMSVLGFGHIYGQLRRRRSTGGQPPPGLDEEICDAVGWAATLYWKRIRCLQRAVSTARILRRYGFKADLIIGYRSIPFFGHAWVEVDGRVVNDSPAYRERLCILDRV